MNDAVMTQPPLRFHPSMEQPAPDEAETIQGLTETLLKISETTYADSGHATRSVHAKSHGVLRGDLRVLDGLPPALAQGLFAQPGTYKAIVRLSTLPGDILDDEISTPRGLALKIVGVPGARLPGSEGATTQDFVMVNGPAFAAPTSKAFLGNLKTLAGTTDRLEGLKKVVSRIARGTEAVLEAFGTKSPLVVTLGGQPATNILGETFYSQVPHLHGAYVAKLSLAPVSPGLTALTGAAIHVTGRPDALREAVLEHFGVQGGEWELRVQLCTNAETMPIEDASVVWPEAASPYVAVARLSVPPQNSWSADGVREIDEALAFSPWDGLADHRPLGSVQRARRETYEKSAGFRAEKNGCPIHRL